MTILFCTAHPDDGVLGAGGTIAKLVKEGKKVVVVVFSYGEGSDPLKDPEFATIQRIKEAKRAFDVLGVRDTIFLSLSDFKFIDEIKEPSTTKKFEDIFSRYNPTQIYAHSIDDPNSAHSAVSAFVRDYLNKLQQKPDLFEFLVTIPIKFAYRERPRFYIDISEIISVKKRALEIFKSQQPLLAFNSAITRISNWLSGFKSKVHYAEVFYKV